MNKQIYNIYNNTLHYYLNVPLTENFINVCKSNDIREIIFYNKFNMSIDMLGELDRLQKIFFDEINSEFNQPINSLPKNLQIMCYRKNVKL